MFYVDNPDTPLLRNNISVHCEDVPLPRSSYGLNKKLNGQ